MSGSELRVVYGAIWVPAALILAIVAAVLLIVLGVSWWLAIILAVLVGAAAASALAWWAGRDALAHGLSEVRARPLRDGEHPGFPNLVEDLSLSTGLSEPELYVTDDLALNAAALSAHGDSALVMTTGLLDALDRIEAEGVVAALLTRLKDGDAERATMSSAVIGRLVIDGSIGRVLAPMASRAFTTLFAEHREINGDQAAVSVTRYPPGLFAALQKIDAGTHVPGGVRNGSQHLWFVPPAPIAHVPHSPLPWRLDVLSEI